MAGREGRHRRPGRDHDGAQVRHLVGSESRKTGRRNGVSYMCHCFLVVVVVVVVVVVIAVVSVALVLVLSVSVLRPTG